MSNYCINCRYCVPSEAAPNDLELSRCSYEHPISLVTGQLKSISELPFCATERLSSSPEKCTFRGDHFESILISFITKEETQELLQGAPNV